MFRLVKNKVTVIGWFMTSGHSWLGKYKLRQIKYLMGDLGHPHIFTAMFASIGQFKIYPFQLVIIFYLINFS
jgi:hypothetical protein